MDDVEAWYAEVRPRLGAALAAWCGDADLASDALDEAFVRAIERWERVRHLDSPTAWVWRTATNVVRRRTRRRSGERRRVEQLAGDRSGAEVDRRGADRADADVDLRAALLELTERQRTAVVLHHIVDLPVAEVAAAMDVAEGTARATLHQARARLAEMLEPAPTPDPADPPRVDGAIP